MLTELRRRLLHAAGSRASMLTDPVDEAFQTVLGRPPQREEYRWAGSLVASRGRAALHKALAESEEHQALTDARRFVPPGHFYSPVPSRADIEALGPRSQESGPLLGIDLSESQQRDLLTRLAAHYPTLPFASEQLPGLRYRYANDSYAYADGVFLGTMLLELRPSRIIEVGCGNSSCLMLDVNDTLLGGSVELTFIEPFPDYLVSLLGQRQADSLRLLKMRLQDVPLEVFEGLEENDILFIDSTHVAKAGSDVNHLFFEVLPRLHPGVLVHVHDVFASMEYPLDWLRSGHAWNEQYLLRAFLQFNNSFEIVLFGNRAIRQDPEWFAQNMPLCLTNPGGALWLRRK